MKNEKRKITKVQKIYIKILLVNKYLQLILCGKQGSQFVIYIWV